MDWSKGEKSCFELWEQFVRFATHVTPIYSPVYKSEPIRQFIPIPPGWWRKYGIAKRVDAGRVRFTVTARVDRPIVVAIPNPEPVLSYDPYQAFINSREVKRRQYKFPQLAAQIEISREAYNYGPPLEYARLEAQIRHEARNIALRTQITE